jgi:predicted dinucleotide-binding enzyme
VKRSTFVAAVAACALVPLAAPTPAAAQQPTRCLAAYQDKVFLSNMGPVVVFEEPETVVLYPGNAVAPVVYLADATLAYVNCTLGGL